MKNSNNNTAVSETQDFTITEEKLYQAIHYLSEIQEDLGEWSELFWNIATRITRELESDTYSMYVFQLKKLHKLFQILIMNATKRDSGNKEARGEIAFYHHFIGYEGLNQAFKYLANEFDNIEKWPDKIMDILVHLDGETSTEEYSDFVYHLRHLHKFFEILIQGMTKTPVL